MTFLIIIIIGGLIWYLIKVGFNIGSVIGGIIGVVIGSSLGVAGSGVLQMVGLFLVQLDL